MMKLCVYPSEPLICLSFQLMHARIPDSFLLFFLRRLGIFPFVLICSFRVSWAGFYPSIFSILLHHFGFIDSLLAFRYFRKSYVIFADIMYLWSFWFVGGFSTDRETVILLYCENAFYKLSIFYSSIQHFFRLNFFVLQFFLSSRLLRL